MVGPIKFNKKYHSEWKVRADNKKLTIKRSKLGAWTKNMTIEVHVQIHQWDAPKNLRGRQRLTKEKSLSQIIDLHDLALGSDFYVPYFGNPQQVDAQQGAADGGANQQGAAVLRRPAAAAPKAKAAAAPKAKAAARRRRPAAADTSESSSESS